MSYSHGAISSKKKRAYNTPLPRGSSRQPKPPGRSVGTAWSILFALNALIGCAVAKEPYLADHVGRATEQEVRARLGEPLFMQPGEGSGVRWIYREGDIWVTKQPAQGRAASDCLEYHLNFDSRKVLTDWTKAAC